MAARRLSVRKIREVLRLGAEGLSDREIGRSLRIGKNTVRRYRTRAEAAGVEWPLPPEMTESALESRLFPGAPRSSTELRAAPDWAYVHRELRRPGVTLQLLWLEYKEGQPDGYQYSQFCARFREWKGALDLVLRQEHRAGEKVFVDYAGQTVPVADPATGEIREAQVFVATMGASNFLYVEATWSQALADWIQSHVRMFEYLGGVPHLVVPDNLRSGVSRACWYDPDTNPTYQELGAHYGTGILPTRPGKPKDKAKVESGVLVAERLILAPLRNHTFSGLAELNQALRSRLEAVNDRPFQKLEGTRRSLFEELDRPALKRLPDERYAYAEWRKARANIDYHISVEGHLYSVPFRLVREEVKVRLTATTVEAFHDGRRVAAHVRGHRKGGFTTDPTHRPKAHQEHLAWPPSRLIRWAERTGPHTAAIVRRILEERPHPEQGYRPCLGILRLGDRYTPERLEAACKRAVGIQGISYRSIKSILDHGLDRLEAEEEAQTTLALPQSHPNLRGADYYATLPR